MTSESVYADEETPLLMHNKRHPTPLPWSQFSIVLLLQLTEPLTSHVIPPFAPQLVRDTGVTKGNESQVGFYVGILYSVFFVAEAVTVLHWSRMSDRVGRKPVILSGLFGLSIAMYCFGLSTTFWGFVVSRSLTGALNGNVGVIKSIMAEMTDSTNISRAYGYLPLSWSTGLAVGPLIGGLLAGPADRFPAVFGNNEFLKSHPYFLPCAIPATLSALIWIIVFIFFKETSPRANFGAVLSWRKSNPGCTGNQAKLNETQMDPLPLKSLLTFDVVITSGNYALVALIDIAFRAIFPVFLSTPIHLGGLGLTTPIIGKILFIIGLLNAMQFIFFARLNDRWGSKNVFMAGLISTLPAFALFPVINILALHSGCSFAVWVAVATQIVTFSMLNICYGNVFIFITAASPSRSSVGTTNGLGQVCVVPSIKETNLQQVTVSLMRAIGPAITNSLFSLSVEKRYLGGYLVYYILICVSLVSLYIGSLIPRRLQTDRKKSS